MNSSISHIEGDLGIGSVSGIGPKYRSLLEGLDIYTLKDLLYHFPHRYDDYSSFSKIKNLPLNQIVSIKAYVSKVDNIYSKYGKKLTKAELVDETGKISALWFNQHYLKTVLKVNREYIFSGKVTEFNSKPTFISPEFEEESEGDNLHTGRLVPVYPETMGVSSKWLRSRINDVISIYFRNEDRDSKLENINSRFHISEFIPDELLSKYGLPRLREALISIHFPQNIEEAQKARQRFSYEEIFLELLRVEERKKSWDSAIKGAKLDRGKFEHEISSFIDSLPFTLTPEQKTALDDILNDLNGSTAMNRLLEGDVGTGKTIVAIISAYLTILNGWKVIYMAPTEILAKQHFDTFNKFLSVLDKKVKVIIKTSATKNTLKEEFDIAIGTHALLYQEEDVPKLGLIIIDEQHRFGVEQRTQLINMTKEKVLPNLLTMTATPIPRTLALTLYGDLDISVLKTHPNKDKKITTKAVLEKQRDSVYQWVADKNEQTFIVCPFIEESKAENLQNIKSAKEEFEKLKKYFLEKDMRLLHGKMPSKEKNSVLDMFRKGDIKILVSTPVIEVGVDVPEAVIMVIESAERYGLASLHQLRGRVGRGDKEGYCFLITSDSSTQKIGRLRYLEKLNSGLELAEIDLKIRGQGDIFGTMQSGFKKFKVFNLSDLETLENAKKDAQRIFKDINNYIELKNILEVKNRNVGRN